MWLFHELLGSEVIHRIVSSASITAILLPVLDI